MSIDPLLQVQCVVENFVPRGTYLKKNFTISSNPLDQALAVDLLHYLYNIFPSSFELEKLRCVDNIIAKLKEKIIFTSYDSAEALKIRSELQEIYFVSEIPEKLLILRRTRIFIVDFFQITAHKVWNNYYKKEAEHRFHNLAKVAKTRTNIWSHFFDKEFLKRLSKTQLGMAIIARFCRADSEGRCKINCGPMDLAWLNDKMTQIPDGEESQDIFSFFLLIQYSSPDWELDKSLGKKFIFSTREKICSSNFFEVHCPDLKHLIIKMKKVENEMTRDPMNVMGNLAKELVATQKTLDRPYRALYSQLLDARKSHFTEIEPDIPYLDGVILISARKFEDRLITIIEEPVMRRDVNNYYKSDSLRLVIPSLATYTSSPDLSTPLSLSPTTSPPSSTSSRAKKKKRQAAKKKLSSTTSSPLKSLPSSSSSAPISGVSPASISLSSSSSSPTASPSESALASCSSSSPTSNLASATCPASISLSSTTSSSAGSTTVSPRESLASCSSSTPTSTPAPASSPGSISMPSIGYSPSLLEAAPPRVSSNFSSLSRAAPPAISTIPLRTAPSPFCKGTSPIKEYHPRAWAEWQPAEDGRIEALDRKGYAEAGPLKRQAGFMRHAFTQFVDRFVGGPYSMYIPASASCPSDTYLIYGEIEWTDSAGKTHVTRGQFSYGIDKEGTCFHRYLTRKTSDEVTEEFLQQRSQVDYPSLTKSHGLYLAKAKDLSEIRITAPERDISYQVGPLDTISFRDEENNCTITLFKLERD